MSRATLISSWSSSLTAPCWITPGCRVDVVSERGLKPRIRERVLRYEGSKERLRDMREAIAKIERYASRGHGAFEQEELVQVLSLHRRLRRPVREPGGRRLVAADRQRKRLAALLQRSLDQRSGQLGLGLKADRGGTPPSGRGHAEQPVDRCTAYGTGRAQEHPTRSMVLSQD